MKFYKVLLSLFWQFLIPGIEVGTDEGADSYRYTGKKDFVYRMRTGNLEFSITEKIILKANVKNNETAFLVELGLSTLQKLGLPQLCDLNPRKDNICFTWNNLTVLQIKKVNNFCHRVIWNSSDPVEDCFDYTNANWFGGSEFIPQLWPIDKLQIYNLPYVISNQNAMGVAERLWMNSKGLLIFVDDDVPLFIDSNNHKNNSLCFISKNIYPYHLNRTNNKLNYLICQLDNARKAQEFAVQEQMIYKPVGLPDTKMIEYPIWSTWVKFKFDINETVLIKFAEDIVNHGFNISQLEIDDKWETCYGSMLFNKTRFPDMKLLSNKLKKIVGRLTLWRHPFVNKDCSNYTVLKKENYLVKNVLGSDTVVWWDGIGSIYDFTDIKVRKWFQEKHKNLLEENGIDGFKFDAGESTYIPVNALLNSDINKYPNSFTGAYLETISAFGNMTETRVGHRSQHYPIFLRMLDKDSRWGLNNGLASVITTCLLMNLNGYSWVLPDMVGGNAYGEVITAELYIRWLQANTFLPVIQLSVSPWDFNNQSVVEIAKKFTALHYSYSEKIKELMKKTVEKGSPLNPPIWWIDPEDPVALKIDSEYLLGEDILVAPVLKEGATKRDVYLPVGNWKDGNNESITYKGPLWIKNYPADLSTLPFFIRIQNTK